MTDYIRRAAAKLRRILQFAEDHPLVPPNPAATAEVTAIDNTVTQIEDSATAQDSGKGTKSGAVNQRLFFVEGMMNLLRSLAKAAKVLDVETHPEVATKMRVSGIDSFEALMTRAKLFHSTLVPIEAEFVALGASATVAADLLAMITAAQAAWDLKLTGIDLQIGGTFGLKVKAREGLKHARKLDAILCQVYRTNPVLLAQWKAANRAERAPVSLPSGSAPDDGSGGGGDSGGTAPATA